jgi:hypothetical protein
MMFYCIYPEDMSFLFTVLVICILLWIVSGDGLPQN